MSALYDPKFRRLLDWAEARREGINDAPIPSADDDSLDAVMWVESFLDAAEVLARIEPPASLRSRLQTAFSNHRRRDDERSAAVEMLGLVADSRTRSELVGVRGSATSEMPEAYQLLFGRRPATVFVEVTPTSAVSVRITGQFVDRRSASTGTGAHEDSEARIVRAVRHEATSGPSRTARTPRPTGARQGLRVRG